MKRLFFLLVIFLSTMTACNEKSPDTANQEVQVTSTSLSISSNSQIGTDGQLIYASYCAECHGLDGEGRNPENPFAADAVPPHDETGHTWHHDDDLLIEIVTTGGINGQMPAFGEQLSAQQIEAVLTYIKTFWTDEQRAHQEEVTRVIRGQ